MDKTQDSPPSTPKTDILPSSYHDPNGVPIFTPTIHQFSDFMAFVKAIEPYGRSAGIVKVIPPREWTTGLPDFTGHLENVRISRPIVQEINGGGLPSGAYFQCNIEQRKTYSVQDWYDLANSPAHKPPQFDENGKAIIESHPVRKKARKSGDSTRNDSLDPSPVKQEKQEDMQSHKSGVGNENGSAVETANGSTSMDIESDSAPQNIMETSEPTNDTPTSMETAAPITPQNDTTSMETEAQSTPQNDTTSNHLPPTSPPIPMIKLIPGQNSPFGPIGLSGRPSTSAGRKAWREYRENYLRQKKSLTPSTTPKPKTPKPPKPVTPTPSVPITFSPSTLPGPSTYTPTYLSNLEKYYWRNITYMHSLYGADMLGSLFDSIDGGAGGAWNLARLDNILSRVDVDLPGVNRPYLYWGMWGATFAWHVEDMDLYSINYIHFGAPKQWYVIPPSSRTLLERLARTTFTPTCPEFLRHKTHILSPKLLTQNNIPFHRLVQQAGEFVITFPYGYHQGYNTGFNCAESVNFADEGWVEVGKRAGWCGCVGDSVRLDVEGIFGGLVNGGEGRKRIKLLVKKREEDGIAEEEKPKKKKELPPPTTTYPEPTIKKRPSLSAPSLQQLKRRKSSTPLPPTPVIPPGPRCILCPVGIEGGEDWELLDTDVEGVWAHRRCAGFVPETWVERVEVTDAGVNEGIAGEDGQQDGNSTTVVIARPTEEETQEPKQKEKENDKGKEIVKGINSIPKDRYKLRCTLCTKPTTTNTTKKPHHPTSGTPIQCSKGKCLRAYHILCATLSPLSLLHESPDGFLCCYCPQHHPLALQLKQHQKEEEERRKKEVFTQGVRVWARVEGGWYEGVVVGVEERGCRVRFLDGGCRVVGWGGVRGFEGRVGGIEVELISEASSTSEERDGVDEGSQQDEIGHWGETGDAGPGTSTGVMGLVGGWNGLVASDT